ncbi:MAG TPA: anhydro-N-acetylmuramic acid kinase [Bacteroidetes bacterium]|nr:anhydro-N-acetylmuramic acid kinase [Bacteroidota bacterium]
MGDGKWNFEILASETIPIDEQWFARLKCLDEQNAETFAKTNVYFGHYLGRHLASFIERNELRPHFVASHGQTIFHQPGKNFTAQIGDGETIASYLACPLVTNFRNKDVALGGQGAPLVPFGEKWLFPDEKLFLNLGGIANLSFGPLAFDVTVCNMGLNWLSNNLSPALPYDLGGQIARSGNIHPDLYEALEKLEYFRLPAPKSLGAEWFTTQVLPLIANAEIPLPDRLHTLVFHIISRITFDLRELGAQDVALLATGGGVHNTFLMEELEKSIAPRGISIKALPKSVIDYKEALIFAFLGLQTLLGRPNVFASVTGAKCDNVGGSIHLPPGGLSISLLD